MALLDLLIANAIKISFLLFHGIIAMGLTILFVILILAMIKLLYEAWIRIRKELYHYE